jgi:hypothetical protein
MKRITLLSLIILSTLSFNSCKLDEDYNYIKYSNNTNDTIVIFAKGGKNTVTYDTGSYGYGCTELSPNTIATGPYIQESLKDSLFFYIVNKSLSEYLNSGKSLNTLVHYSLSKKDMEKIGYTISYPPTPAMKDMKMNPSYEEFMKNYK